MHTITSKFLSRVLLLCVIPVFAYSATENFPVVSLVGSDTEDPTIPTGLTATGVATTQIDLSWSSSTDNFVLSGYHVWRANIGTGTSTGTTGPSVLIATTTIPFYSDTGLTASTSYLYYVTAFDSVFNESASSTVATGTTLSVSVTPTSTSADSTDGPRFGSRLRPVSEQIELLKIFPQRDTVVIQFETDGYIRSVLKWGISDLYELGSLAERAFSRKHETTIVGLTPGTRYEFTIEGEDRHGRHGVMHTGSFTTLAPEDTFPPGNVTNLTALREDIDDVFLSWVNPPESDFSHVRIVRNDRFYPSDIADGWVVYEGDATSFRDVDALSTRERQFYTVFSYDTLGNVSSGAVVMQGMSVTPDVIVDPAKNEAGLRFEHIQFLQEGIELLKKDNSILIDGSKQLTIRIPYERFPEHLKTILITLEHPTDKGRVFSFLLRVTKDKSAYESTIAPLGIQGTFPMSLSVFDYETEQIGYVSGEIISHVGFIDKESPGVFVLPQEAPNELIRTLIILIGIILMVLLTMRFGSRIFTIVRK